MKQVILYLLFGGILFLVINRKNIVNSNIVKNNKNNSKKILDFFIPKTTSSSSILNKDIILHPILKKDNETKKKNIIYPRQLKFNNDPIIYQPKYQDNYVSDDPSETEYFPVDIDNKVSKSWTDKNISEHPKYYRANIEDEVTNVGAFFDKNNQYFDITSNRSKNNLPDRCFLNDDQEVECEFNNRLYNIPPKLINNKNNKYILNDVGVKKQQNEIYKNKKSKSIENINGNNYDVWEYSNEIDDEFFKDIKGYNQTNQEQQQIFNMNNNNIAI